MKIPMRILRHLKQAFFEYTITTKASNTIQVLTLDDIDYENEDILVTLGRSSEMSKFGLLGITSDDIYKDIFLDTLSSKFQADDILEVIVGLEKSATKLPKYKYLNKAKKQPPSNLRTIERTYDDFISATVIRDRSKKQFVERSVKGILKYHNKMPAYYMQFLSKDELKLEDLESYLISEFTKDPDIIATAKGGKRTDLKRLIRIYDFLKYKKEL